MVLETLVFSIEFLVKINAEELVLVVLLSGIVLLCCRFLSVGYKQ